MYPITLQVTASIISTFVIGILGTRLGWDNTAVWAVAINWFIIFLPQLIVRFMTYGERRTTSERIVEEAVGRVGEQLQGEVKRIDREIEKVNKRSVTLDSVYAKEFQQIKEEIVRMGGRRLSELLRGRTKGGGGALRGNLQVEESRTKWRTIKRTTEKAWNGVRRRLE